jgi:hypothetical protein
MTKFNQKKVTSKVKAPTSAIKTSTVPNTRTALGGIGFTRDTKGELYLLAVSNFVGVNLFHEKAAVRDNRFEQLIHAVAVADPEWMLNFVTWLRKGGNMRSASLVAGAEACRALLAAGNTDGWARRLISAPLQRADEPGEMLSYWAAFSETKQGKALKLPKPVKRGVADAVQRLFTEYSSLKYDGKGNGMRFGDVIELTHPTPADDKPNQGTLFKYLLDRRHDRAGSNITGLHVIDAHYNLRGEAGPQAWLDTRRLKAAGMTWEDAMSAVGSKLDKKDVWEAMIPNMGLFALVRNLRNFSDAKIGKNFRNLIALKLDDEEEVRRSMMFPFRFLAAYRAAGSDLNWVYPLEQALGHSLSNVPELTGRTLILVDQSPSMFPGPYYAGNRTDAPKSDISFADQAKVFASALALRAENADLIQYGLTSAPVAFRQGESMLKVMERFKMIDGTNTPAAAHKYFKGHDRIIILTDEQTTTWSAPGGGHYERAPVDWASRIGIPQATPIYTWNLAGYKAAHLAGTPNRHWFGGMTDQAFSLIPLLESGADGTWPWTQATAA